MILLVTPSLRGEESAQALQEATGNEVTVAESLRQATTLLRAHEYVSVVLDQYLVETEPDETSTLMEHLGTAIPVQVNLAVSAMERVIREVRAAIQRRTKEQLIARRAAQETLQSELNSTVTALLLQCELALATPDVPPATSEKLRSARDLVNKLRTQMDAAICKN
jgi:hypothetical protein